MYITCARWCAQKHGPYGVTVNTEVCGTSDSGSIPDMDPIKFKYMGFIFLI